MVVRIRSTFTDIQCLCLLVPYIHLISALGESPAKLVYGTQGGSITFHLEKRPEPTFQDFYWTFSSYRLAACGRDKCIIYTEKTSICNATFSLELKDIAQADDGYYNAVIIGNDSKMKNISTQRLIVQAPVSKPVIHISAVSSPDGRCNVTLNCTAERGTSVSLQWDWTGIHHTAINADNGSVLYFSLDPNADGSFTCKAHNQVSNSSENVPVEKIKCFDSSENTILPIIIVLILASVLLIIAVVKMTFQKRRRGSFNLGQDGHTDRDKPAHSIF
ncbi:SLAM family member 9-like [Acipenser oxyrinchus oxyrinchus]|uniref:SLAM family member 9-like n=1 Tax=Acipenser oxyrinchus oxyrinchus TaxID=40147 RepID=A0AAD8CFV0_ACIOX|nr:SLAM family member 9-like [Acipenser oxyrinchus oxyrinchus]